MKLLDYEYHDHDWDFHQVRFQQVNLIVGDSGSGKTRLLNTLFNLGTFIAQGKVPRNEGEWAISFGVDKNIYKWNVSIVKKDDKTVVGKEELFLNEEPLVKRDGDKFEYRDKDLPKLTREQMSLYILKEEELIKPLHDGFLKILRRKFFEDDLAKNAAIMLGSQKQLDSIGNGRDLEVLFNQDLMLNPRLYILSRYFPDIFKEIVAHYKDVFDFISDAKVLLDHSDGINIPMGTPIFCIKERNVNKWMRLSELSSGMQKVLLILTDLLSLPKGTIYLIDEYENSLGPKAIRFLPHLLLARDFDLQILMTSHHPYIISNIPVEHWYVAHRQGSQVQFAYGEDLVKRYSSSSQEKYIQLLNDPFYSEGIE